MKTSKFFFSTLIAAAAMSAVPVFAADQVYTEDTEISSGLTVDGKISVNAGATVEQSGGVVSAGRLVLNDSNAQRASNYTLSGGVLNITGEGKAGGVTTDGDTQTNAVLLGHWRNGASILKVSGGSLNVLSGYTVLSWDSAGTLDISGGNANLYGISLNTYRGNAANVSLSSGRLNLGAGGLTYGTGGYGKENKTVTLSGGTIGALEDWESDVSMNITGGVTFDTTKQVVTDGAASADSSGKGAKVVLRGNLSGAGSLNIEGSGVLKLAGAVELAGGITNNGTITVGASAVFMLDELNKEYILVRGEGKIDGIGMHNFSVGGNSSGISGRSTGVISNSDGVLSVTITKVGDAATVVWAGTESANTWNMNASNKIWTNNEESDSFYGRDSATFDSTALNKTVSIGSDIVAGTVKVDGNYTFSATEDATLYTGDITVVSGNTLTLSAETGKTLTVLAATKGGASLVKSGAGTVSIANTGNSFSSIEVKSGRLELGSADDNSVGSFKIASGATLALVSGNDMARWSGPSATSYDIAGTLDMGSHRFSISGATFKLDGGCIVGQGDGYGALDFFNATTVNISGSSEIAAKVRMRESGDVTFSVSEEGCLTFSGDVTGEKTLTKSGAGELVISGGTKSFSSLNISEGTATISGGTVKTTIGTVVSGSGTVLTLGKNGDGSQSFLRGALTIQNGGKVVLSEGDATGYDGGTNAINTLTINEGGMLEIQTNSYDGTNQTFNMSGGIMLKGGKITGTNSLGYSKFDLFRSTSGITTLASGTTAEISASIGLRDSGTFTINKGTTEDGVDLLVSGMLTNHGRFRVDDAYNNWNETKLIKRGTGTMKLTGNNSHWVSGGEIQAGCLIAGSSSALGSGRLTVAEGATLGFVAGTTVTGVTGGIELADGAMLAIDLSKYDLNQYPLPSSGENSQIILDLVSGVAIKYNNVLVDSSNVGDIDIAYELVGWEEYKNLGWTHSLNYANGSLNLTIAIPEPSTFGLLAGLGALTLVGTRRRRAKKD